MFEARPRRSVVTLVGALAAVFACVSELDRDALGGRPCPCLKGWVCDASQGARGICVESISGAGGAGSAPSDTGGAAGTSSGAAAGSPSDAGPLPGADGGGATGGSSGTTNGECGVAATAAGASCPAECDDCSGGTCRIRCDGSRDCAGTAQQPLAIACPPGWHCEVSCSTQDSCKTIEIQCSGAQSCSVLCTGRRSCVGLTLACAEGPCELACGSEAQACKNSILACGTNSCQASCQGIERPLAIGCASSCSPVCGC